MSKPKFYETELKEIPDVIKYIYPLNDEITMAERMGNENAECPDCGNNEWWLLPKECVAVREGGKPYIQCLYCVYHTHL